MAARYVATINVPGYLPDMADEPPTFETAAEGWAYLRDERERAEDGTGDYAELVGGGDAYSDTRDTLDDRSIWASSGLVCDFEAVGTVYGPTPGYRGDHDLGVAYSVTEVETPES